jgi:hypothetical protein
VEPRASRIQGRGLFALREFGPRDIVSVVGGEPISGENFSRFIADGRSFNAIQVDEDLHLVEPPAITSRREASLNHHCDSNLWMRDEVTIVARQLIAAGSELTIDYALFTTSPDWSLVPCNCGAPLCRHTPRGTDWTLPEVQSRYRGHFSPFLNRRITASITSGPAA